MLVWLADVCVLYNHDNAGGLMAEATAAGHYAVAFSRAFSSFFGVFTVTQPAASVVDYSAT